MNNKNKRTDPNHALYHALLQLHTAEECYRFFTDLCTVSEMKAMEQRYDVAELLDGGSVYNEIQEKTGASSTTIGRVNKCLNYGSDGYKMILGRMEQSK
ncbi:MAG: YerC/YecD family TrpR-related protein [Oscillospiraceae bacterium]|nr:YerC/YecD family TrpR-related protein [Oscillospiraceae bacterium]